MRRQRLIPIAVIAVLLLLWQISWELEWVPRYMLPSPVMVVEALISDFPLLMSHAGVTLLEALIGLVTGVLTGFICAAVMDAFPKVREGLYPILVMTQTIPPVAVAPLLILWFSYGMTPKIILVVLVAFFPMAVGLLEGFESADQDMIRMMRSMKASRWQIFRYVKFPNALGEFYSGLRIAVAYSIVGAVIAEWLGGFSGLGVYMTRVKKSLAYDKMFAVIFLVSAISLILMALVRVIQKKTMPWNYIKDEK